jgi:hypothetical protein
MREMQTPKIRFVLIFFFFNRYARSAPAGECEAIRARRKRGGRTQAREGKGAIDILGKVLPLLAPLHRCPCRSSKTRFQCLHWESMKIR